MPSKYIFFYGIKYVVFLCVNTLRILSGLKTGGEKRDPHLATPEIRAFKQKEDTWENIIHYTVCTVWSLAS